MHFRHYCCIASYMAALLTNCLVCTTPTHQPSAAGEAFCQAAEVHRKLEVKHEAAANLVDAGQVLKKESPKREH